MFFLYNCACQFSEWSTISVSKLDPVEMESNNFKCKIPNTFQYRRENTTFRLNLSYLYHKHIHIVLLTSSQY